jgi:hypothetical protein
VQWLTPQNTTPPNANWRNYNTFNPFYSPEWIEWQSAEPLDEVWVYNGRYASGASATNFKDYQLLVSHDGGTTWESVKSGAFNNVQGIDGDNNKLSLQPNYTWKTGATTVGTGKQLNLVNVTTTADYFAELSYGCGTPTVSNNAAVTVIPPVGDEVETPVFVLGATSSRCQGTETVTYTATALNATGITYSLDATTLAFAGNSINIVSGAVTFAAAWTGTSEITASAAGVNGPKTAIHTVTTALDPSITISGANQTVCPGDNGPQLTATILNGVGCGAQWQTSPDGKTWADIPGETALMFTPTNVANSAFYRAITSGCVTGCDVATSKVIFISVNHISPSFSIQPTPVTQSVCNGDDVSISCEASIGSGATHYRLVLLSAHGAGWHGLQEIQGYNLLGSPVALTCTAASSATYTANPTDNSAYSAQQAFDGEYNSALSSMVQWLTPQNTTSPNINFRNYNTFNLFYSPEWIEWQATEPLNEVWVYNGRYASGASATNFKDYQLLVSHDGGATWQNIKSGAFNNVQGIDGNNNKLSLQPNYTWKTGATTVGTGKQLNLVNVTTTADYFAELSYGCGTPTVSNNATVTIDAPVIDIQPVSPSPVCVGESIAPLSVTPTGTGHTFQWYSNTINSNTGGALLTDQTSSTYTPSSTTAGTVYYYCEVTHCGMVASSTATVTVYRITITIANVTANNVCPELDLLKGFNPENGPLYSSGSTEIVFSVERNNSFAATWEFDYEIEDATVSVNPASPNPQSGTIENISGDVYEIHFFIVNNPGNPIPVKLVVSEVRDSNGCSDNSEHEETITISAMPVVGSFN